MSLITQCPACTTLFKVVPDQLRISDGWVRCGQCDEVFDANANLYSDPGRDPEPVVPEENDQAPSTEEDWKASLRFAAESEMPESPETEEEVTKVDEIEVLDAPPVRERAVPEALNIADAQKELDALLDLRPGHGRDTPDPVSVEPEEDVPAPEPRYAQAQVKTVDPADAPKLSFMRQTRGPSVWQRTSVRALLSLVALVLLGGLLLQVVVHERDRIAATEPGSQEALVALCEWLDCTVGPVRQIESVVIDSSSFTKVRADVYRLNFTLKSTAAIGLAMPALELTLTDMQDQPVVRRVLLASELAPGRDLLGAGAELTTAIPISVKQGSGTERISGYRLLAFYP